GIACVLFCCRRLVSCSHHCVALEFLLPGCDLPPLLAQYCGVDFGRIERNHRHTVPIRYGGLRAHDQGEPAARSCLVVIRYCLLAWVYAEMLYCRCVSVCIIRRAGR